MGEAQGTEVDCRYEGQLAKGMVSVMMCVGRERGERRLELKEIPS